MTKTRSLLIKEYNEYKRVKNEINSKTGKFIMFFRSFFGEYESKTPRRKIQFRQKKFNRSPPGFPCQWCLY